MATFGCQASMKRLKMGTKQKPLATKMQNGSADGRNEQHLVVLKKNYILTGIRVWLVLFFLLDMNEMHNL